MTFTMLVFRRPY